MAPDATLLAIEINPRFAEGVRESIDDPRLIVHTGDASKIDEALAEHGLDAPEVVVSGIPFSCMPKEIGEAIQISIRETLAPHGRFVAYQLRSVVAKIGSEIFGKPKVSWELANFPPMRIFRFDMPSQNGQQLNGNGHANGNVNGH
jgi:phosphatidylethanolamine/phosphatidyl-N-methylethanolamine N-methyltransferase